MIPKIIHQTWKNSNLCDDFTKWSNSWKNMNPDYIYKFYTDRDIFKFIHTNYPQYLDLYEFLTGIEKIDFFRYLIIYHQGGIYIDMDCECLRPLDDLFKTYGQTKLITGYEYNSEDNQQYLQWFIASPSKNSVLLDLVNEIQYRSYFKWFKSLVLSENDLVYWLTGPQLYTEVLKNNSDNITVLSKGLLGCYDKKLITNESYLRHMFSGSWKKHKCKSLQF